MAELLTSGVSNPDLVPASVSVSPAVAALRASTPQLDIPKGLAQAKKTSAWSFWEAACLDELASILSHRVFTLMRLPPGRTAIPTHWVFDLKRDAHGNIIRFKARLVVDGSRQIYGIDFSEVFSPTSHLTTVRLLLALAAAEDLNIEILDVKTAFLHGELEEDIFVTQPPGFPLGDPSMVCKLNKSLYGLRQAARTWHLRQKAVLEGLGLGLLSSDRTLFSGWLAGGFSCLPMLIIC